jgi:hypothetical protein
MTTIPSYIATDRYWKGVLHLFSKHYKLQRCLNTKYFDLETGTIEIAALKRLARGTKTSASWSTSEKFMLNLALHLYNDNNKVNLSDMDFLDDYNKKLAMEAIKLRFF